MATNNQTEVDKNLIDGKTETLKSDLENDKESKDKAKLDTKKKPEDDYSSGVESDHDVDLLVE